MNEKSKIFIFSIFIFIIISLVSNFNFFDIVEQLYQPINTLKGALKASIYIFAYIFVFVNFILLLFMRKCIVFFVLSSILFVLFVVDVTYYFVGEHSGFSIEQIIVAINEKNYILSTIATYSKSVFFSVVLCLILTFIVFFVRKKIHLRMFYLPLLMLPFSLFGSYEVMQRSAFSAYEYLSFVKIPINVAIVKKSSYINLPFSKRKTPHIKPQNESKYKNIILIVDESVRADYLSLNGFKLQTTPFLDNFTHVKSLGIASSSGNISALSQYIIRNGVALSELPDKNFKTLKKPSIFAYAKNAGFKTYLLDAQVPYNQMQNMLSRYDLETIDEYWTIKNRTPFYDLDQKLLKKMSNELQNDEKKFFYIVKNGSHAPHLMNYPQQKAYFKPVLEDFESITPKNRDRAINTYANSIKWGVDEWFEAFLSKLNLKESFIIYTSDHGFNIAELGTNMHYGMNKNPPFTTATVPILLFTQDIKEKFVFKKNIYSHFHIFPSVLNLLGYEKDFYIKHYGLSFFDDVKQESRYFYSGNLWLEGKANLYEYKF